MIKRLVILILMLPCICCAALVTLSTSNDFADATVSSSDMQIFTDGLKLRQHDVYTDYSVPAQRTDFYQLNLGTYYEPALESSSDVPLGSGYAASIKGTSWNLDTLSPSTTYGCSMQMIYFGYDSAIIKPAKVTHYFKAPYHDSTSNGKFYVFANNQISQCSPFEQEQMAISTWNALDCHLYAGPGMLSFGCSDPRGNYDAISRRFSAVTNEYNSTYINNNWIKYETTYDWDNNMVSWAVDGDVQDYLAFSETDPYQTISGGWLQMWNIGNSPSDRGAYYGHNPDFQRITAWAARVDYSASGDPSFGPIVYYQATDFSKWRIKSGSTILNIPTSSLSETITTATLSWVATDDTDSNLSFVASRSWATDTTRASASSFVSGHPAGDAIATTDTYHSIKDHTVTSKGSVENHNYMAIWQPKYWQAQDTTASWTYDCENAKIASYFTIAPFFTDTTLPGLGLTDGSTQLATCTIEGITISGSQTNEAGSWTQIYNGTYNDDYWSNEIVTSNTTAYRYYKFDFTGHESRNPGLYSIELRDGNTRSASAWTTKTVQVRYTTDGTTPTGSWATVTSGETFFTGSVAKEDFVVQAQVSLTTDCQKYLPVISSLTLSDQDQDPSENKNFTNATLVNGGIR